MWFIKNFELIAVGIVSSMLIGFGIYIEHLKANLKQAEANTMLVVREFDTLYNTHNKLVINYDVQTKLHKDSIILIKQKHKAQVQQLKIVIKIKTEIANVKDKDDGFIAPILSSTIDALRLLD